MKQCEVSCTCSMEIKEVKENHERPEEDPYIPRSYREIRNFVFAKLVNTRANIDLVAKLPNKAILDLSVIFYFFKDGDPDGEEIFVTKKMAEDWGVDTACIFSDAMVNTRNFMGECVRPLKEVIDDLIKDLVSDMDAPREDEGLPMYVLTNLWKRNGAICILYEDTVKELADMLGSDLYVIPSSIHEMILVPAERGVSKGELDRLIREINSSELMPEDVLSDHTYVFSRQLEHIMM